MSLRVFAAPGDWATGLRLRLDEAEARYLVRVRRAPIGATVEVLDGIDQRWRATVVEHGKRDAVLELLDAIPTALCPPLVLLLVAPEIRATLEAVTHACELGVTRIDLLRGEHSPGPLPSAERVERTIQAAQRQCGRPVPPRIHRPATLDDALGETAELPGIVASLRPPATGPVRAPSYGQGARVLVGPEGGLSEREEQRALAAGLSPTRLGPWVLRTPTAVCAALAHVQSRAGSIVAG